MVIVSDFGPDVQCYQQDCRHSTYPRPSSCPRCAATGRLIGHGSYPRRVCDHTQVFPIRVKRLFCSLCHHTVSLLPSFCLPHRQYLASTIQSVLSLRLERKGSWQELQQRFSPSDLPTLTTCRAWVGAFAKASSHYLGHLLHQLALWQLAPGKLEVAIDDIAAGPKGPAQLLAAVPHLLAWLHDQGLAVAEDGARWLEKLGEWGQRANLGRLV